MSFPHAIPHLEAALTHAKAGNAAKAMHHIGHALFQVRSMTSNPAGGKMPMDAPMTAPKTPATGGTIIPQTQAPQANPMAEQLRARLMGLGR